MSASSPPPAPPPPPPPPPRPPAANEKQAIKAYVRVRPFTAKEMVARPQPCIRPSGKRILVEHEVVAQAEAESGRAAASPRGARERSNTTTAADGPLSTQNHTFEFDGVFWSVPPNQVLTEEEAQDEYYLSALPPFADQDQLFQEVGVSAVDSLLKGFPVTVFAYGQTGSGKSHTIFGPMSDPGLSPRMAIEMFRIIDAERQFGWKAEVALSCFEIYNEKVTDLLGKAVPKPSPKQGRRRAASSARLGTSQRSAQIASPLDVDDLGDVASTQGSTHDALTPNRTFGSMNMSPRTPRLPGDHAGDDLLLLDDDESIDASSTADGTSYDHTIGTLSNYGGGALVSSPSRANFEAEAKELKVRQHPDLGVFVEGLRKEQVGDAHQLTSAIHTALNHRVTAATRMNDTSSRSHAVIQVSVDIRDEVQGKRRAAIMNIIDLAGSERISRSGVTGQQLTEAKNINLSLTTLRRVIDVITENAEKKNKNRQVPPFRESTLTWILMDCFGGSSVTIMLATASPHLDNISDTISTMRYATKCKTIVNQVRANESKIAVTIAAINAESERLRRNIKEVEGNKADYETLMKQEKAKIQRKNNIIKAVMKPTHDRMLAGRDEAEKRLQEARELLATCSARIERQQAKESCEEEVLSIGRQNNRTKVSMELEYRHYRRLETEIGGLKAELNTLLGIKPNDEKSNTFKAMRRTAIRRQIIMYAQEQRDKPIMARLREENAAMQARLEAMDEALEALNERIAEERHQVDIASEPERVKDAAARDLSDAHGNISASIEGFRSDTGAYNKQIALIQREIGVLEGEGQMSQGALDEWAAFHSELTLQLRRSTKEVTSAVKGLSEETEDQLADLACAKKRRRAADDALVMIDEEIRLERERLSHQEVQIGAVRSHVSACVTQLRDDEEERAQFHSTTQDEQAVEQQLNRQCEAVHLAVQGLEKVIRSRCFPDASEVYADRVLARMAVDLETAAAVSPKQLERMRRHQASSFESPDQRSIYQDAHVGV